MKCPHCKIEISIGEVDNRKDSTHALDKRCLSYIWPVDEIAGVEQCKYQEGHNFRHETETEKDGSWRKIGSHKM